MRIHAVGLPHTQMTARYPDCAFTQRLMRISEMMVGRGHEFILYGGAECDAVCTEFVPCLPKKVQMDEFAGGTIHGDKATMPGVQKFNESVIKAIGERIQPKDFILITWGLPQKDVADAFPENISVEGSIGYGSRVLDHAVFDSYTWMHYMYGVMGEQQGKFFDTSIIGPMNPNQFLEAEDHDGYLLFIGRLTYLKGIGIAQALAEAVDMPLVVCGRGDESLLTSDNVDYRGLVEFDERAEILQRATALVAPTQYIEPGGYVVLDAAMAGVPAITTNFGCFLETNVNGYRCHIMSEFIVAAVDSAQWGAEKRGRLQEWARANYGFENVGRQWEAYLERLLNLYGPGFYG